MKALGFRSSTILMIPSPKLLIGFVICSALSVLRILNSTWYSFLCACVCKFLFCLVAEKMREMNVIIYRFLNILSNAGFSFGRFVFSLIFFFQQFLGNQTVAFEVFWLLVTLRVGLIAG